MEKKMLKFQPIISIMNNYSMIIEAEVLIKCITASQIKFSTATCLPCFPSLKNNNMDLKLKILTKSFELSKIKIIRIIIWEKTIKTVFSQKMKPYNWDLYEVLLGEHRHMLQSIFLVFWSKNHEKVSKRI